MEGRIAELEEMLKNIKRREENIAKKYNSIVINE